MSRSAVLLRLSEACNVHRSYHNEKAKKKDNDDDNNKNTCCEGENVTFDTNIEKKPKESQVPIKCRNVLRSLGSILPKVEKKYDYQHCCPTDVSHLCSFYGTIVQRGFCPHAWILFDSGKQGNEIFPRVVQLLQFLSYPPLLRMMLHEKVSQQKNEKRDEINRNKDRRYVDTYDQTQDTIGKLLNMIPEIRTQQQIWKDMVMLLDDLEKAYQILRDYTNYSRRAQDHTMKVQLFASSSHLMKYFIEIPTIQSVNSVQCSTFFILLNLLESSQINLQHNYVLIEAPDLSSNISPIIQSIQSILFDSNWDDNIDYHENLRDLCLALRSQTCAAKLLHSLLKTSLKSSSIFVSVSQIHLYSGMVTQTVCRATKVFLLNICNQLMNYKQQQDTNNTSLPFFMLEEYAIILWRLLQDVILCPSSYFHLDDKTYLSIQNSSLFLLIDCIPYIFTTINESDITPSHKRLCKGILRCILSILTNAKRDTILCFKSYCLTHNICRSLFLLLRESQFGGIVSSLSYFLVGNTDYHKSNEYNILDQVCSSILKKCKIHNAGHGVQSSETCSNLDEPNKTLTRMSSPKRNLINHEDATPISAHKRRRINFDAHEDSYIANNSDYSPSLSKGNQLKHESSNIYINGNNEYYSLFSSLHSTLESAFHFSDEICKLFDLDLTTLECSDFTDMKLNNLVSRKDRHEILTNMTSQRCAEITGVLRLLISCTDYLYYSQAKNVSNNSDKIKETNMKQSYELIEKLLFTIYVMNSAILYDYLNTENEKPFYGPKRLKKMMAIFIGLGFHAYFEGMKEFEKCYEFYCKQNIKSDENNKKEKNRSIETQNHDRQREQQNIVNQPTYLKTLQTVAYCALTVLNTTNEQDTIFSCPNSFDETFINTSKTQRNDCKTYCLGICHNMCTIFGTKRQYDSSLFCLCSFIPKNKNDKDKIETISNNDFFVEELGCSMLETCLPLYARSILLSSLVPMTDKEVSSIFSLCEYDLTDTLSTLFQIAKSSKTSSSTIACILGAFPIIVFNLCEKIIRSVANTATMNYEQATAFLTETLQKWSRLILSCTEHTHVACRRISFISLASLTEIINTCNAKTFHHGVYSWIKSASSLVLRLASAVHPTDKNLPIFESCFQHTYATIGNIDRSNTSHVYELLLSPLSNTLFGCEASPEVRLSAFKFLAHAAFSCSVKDLRTTDEYLYFSSMQSKEKVKGRKEEGDEEKNSHKALHGADVEYCENQNTVCLDQSRIDQKTTFSPFVWLFHLAFIEPNSVVRNFAARKFGLVLLKKKSSLLLSLFLTKAEWKQWESKHEDSDIIEFLIPRFFKEIEKLMHKYCFVSSTQLSYTMGMGTSSNDKSPVLSASATATSSQPNPTPGTNILYQYQFSAINILSSLCEYSDINSISGVLIFEGALLKIIRFWISKKCENSVLLEKTSLYAFSELCRLNRICPLSKIIMQRQETFLTHLFSEMLMPSLSDGVTGDAERFHYIHVFIDSFIVNSPGLKLQQRQVLNALHYIESILPIIIPTFIVEKDFDTLRMVTGLRLYLKKQQKRNNIPKRDKKSPRAFVSSQSSISIKTLTEETKHLCVESRLLEHILPKLLLCHERGPLIFFLKNVINAELNLKDLFTAVQDLVLKNLIWELGKADLNNQPNALQGCVYQKEDVLLALKKGALIWAGKGNESKQNMNQTNNSQEFKRYNSINGVDAMDTDAGKEIGSEAAAKWVGDRFMYLLVNIVNMKLRDHCSLDMICALNCLRLMLPFLKAKDAPQYLPQIMTIIDTAMCTQSDKVSSPKMRYLAVGILKSFVRICLEHQVKIVGNNLTSIIVAIFPVFDESETREIEKNPEMDSDARNATKEGVNFLEWLVTGEIGRSLAPYFQTQVPFLPLTSILDPVRSALKRNGVDLDNLLLLTQWTTQNPQGSASSEGESSSLKSIQSQHALQRRLQVLNKMMKHENVSVRKVVVNHLTDLLRSNRSLFQQLIESEEAESMRFLTVVKNISTSDKETDTDSHLSRTNLDKCESDTFYEKSGSISTLMQTLQALCITENEEEARIAVATALGEVGAIDPNRLGGDLDVFHQNGNDFTSVDDHVLWRRLQPPWKSQIVRYELYLVTNQLATALKASPTAMDQHKISFAIQELLILLNEFSNRNAADDENQIQETENLSDQSKSDEAKQNPKSAMNPWLVCQLERAAVLELVEPFWSTKYQQRNENVAFRNPPFFRKAISYHGWLSHWCRFMIKQTCSNERSRWRSMFHACRAAIRSPAGSTVAEFLLPLLILDMMCFGDDKDEHMTIQEVKDVLSYRHADASNQSSLPLSRLMSANDLHKAVVTIFSTLDTLQNWAENETEERHKSARSGPANEHMNLTSRNKNSISSTENEVICFSWPPDESIARINDLFAALPLSMFATAAAGAGMHARALQYLEMDARQQIVEQIYDEVTRDDSSRELSQGIQPLNGVGKALIPLRNIDLRLMQQLLGKLNESDAMIAVGRELERLGLSHNIIDLIHEREAVGDCNGALQGYEQALQLRPQNHGQSQNSNIVANAITTAEQLILEKGMCKCLLELGQLESVLNQVSGILSNNDNCMKERLNSDKYFASDKRAQMELLPSATEAAWRLGRWSLLEKLVNKASPAFSDSTTMHDAESLYHMHIGQAFLGLHRRHTNDVSDSIRCARLAVMTSLSSVARESYPRFYPYLLRLHCIREIENASEILCPKLSNQVLTTHSLNDESPLETFADYVSSDYPIAWHWEGRMRMAAPELAGSSELGNVRLALSRIAEEPSLEGKLWLSLGRSARKAGLLNISHTAFAHAEILFASFKANASITDSEFDEYSITRFQNEIQLQLAKLKHITGETSVALQMMNMEDINMNELMKKKDNDIDASILLWLNRQHYFSTTKLTIENQSAEQLKGHKKVFGRRLLQATEWIVEGGLCGPEITNRYKLVQRVCPDLERAHFKFARYLDSLLGARVVALSGRLEQRGQHDDDSIRLKIIRADSSCQFYLLNAMDEYGKALKTGQKHLYQAMPRLLTIWFDFNSITEQNTNIFPVASSQRIKNEDSETQFADKQEQANVTMAGLIRGVPPNSFYVALPQLISRVGHNDEDTVRIVKAILKRVLVKFPRQAMWPLAWLLHSADSIRSQCGEEIFNAAQSCLKKQSDKKVHALLIASKSLFKYLIDLAKYVPKNPNKHFNVRPWSGDVALQEFVPPVQAALSLSRYSLGSSSNDSFPSFVPRMRSFSSRVLVMTSKARPKKIKAFAIPAGKNYKNESQETPCYLAQPGDVGEMHFLVKQEAKGDLRKDARVQDLNNVINRLLANSNNSNKNLRQRRRLHLRTFSVVCLSEEAGILEWVPNTDSFRNLVTRAYNPQAAPHSVRRRGKRLANFSDVSLRKTFQKCQDHYVNNGNLLRAASLFQETCLKAYPPVLYWWFVQHFLDQHAWFEARTRFALSAAVWSAVGHVIGLGDRHSENILVDTTCGDCVHVDFDCIFDKGLNLPRPEVVPFRLTPNMIDAFGPTGYEGTFRGGLTSAMTTLRQNRDTLLSVLEPFLKDPVIDWKKMRAQQRRGKQKKKENSENKDVKQSFKVIESRIRGVYNLKNPNFKKIPRTDGYAAIDDDTHILPLSVEGQVNRMINEATSNENLVQLYVGWMPWV